MTDTIINIENYYAGSDETVEAMLDGYCAQWEDALEEVQELETANQALLVERDELVLQLDRWSTEAQEYREAFEQSLTDREAVEAEMDERLRKLRQEMQERLSVANAGTDRYAEKLVAVRKELEEAKEYAARNYEHSYAVDKDGTPKLGSIWKLPSAFTGGAKFLYIGEGQYLVADWASLGDSATREYPLRDWFLDKFRIKDLVPHPDHYGPDAKQAQ